MTTDESALSELWSRLIGTDSTPSTSPSDIPVTALQELTEAATISLAPGDRPDNRTALRNGRRPKLLSTPAGDTVGSTRRCGRRS